MAIDQQLVCRTISKSFVLFCSFVLTGLFWSCRLEPITYVFSALSMFFLLRAEDWTAAPALVGAVVFSNDLNRVVTRCKNILPTPFEVSEYNQTSQYFGS